MDLGRAQAPNETTILNFRRLIEKHELCGRMLDTVNLYLDRKGIRISAGTVVDATIIAAPSSDQEREEGARSRDASDAEGEPVVLRHGDAYRR